MCRLSLNLGASTLRDSQTCTGIILPLPLPIPVDVRAYITG
jgi:hypothetical protein